MVDKPTGTTLGKVVKDVGRGVWDRTFGRLFSANIGNQSVLRKSVAKWSNRDSEHDWRVRLQVPHASPLYTQLFSTKKNLRAEENFNVLSPLKAMRGIFWPLTPTMMVQHSANYNPLAQTHSNYPYQAYQNSQPDMLNIIGDFPVQNQEDAQHWVATVHFLRTMTKGFFGQYDSTGLKGNPPQILHLSGYGMHMFNKVPVVINQFNVEMRAGIDYINTKQPDTYQAKPAQISDYVNVDKMDQTWAPTLSTISVGVTPIYSRNSIRDFNMQDFFEGKLNGKQGKDSIGFI